MFRLHTLLLALALAPSLVSATTLLLAAPNGGLWGVETDPGEPSKVFMAPWMGYPQRGLYYGAVSEDPVGGAGDLLMEIVNEYGDFHGLATGKVCGSRRPDILLEHVMLIDDANPHLSDCGEDCKWSGFLLFGGEIFFLLAGQYGKHSHAVKVVVELRKLAGCDAMYPISDSNTVRKYGDHTRYPVLRCSKSVGVIGEYKIQDNVRTGKYMARSETDESFYFQVSTSGYSGNGFKVRTRLFSLDAATGQLGIEDEVVSSGLEVEAWQDRTRGGVVSCPDPESGDRLLCYGLLGSVRCREGEGGEWTEVKVCEGNTQVDGLSATTECTTLYVACSGENDADNQAVFLLDWSTQDLRLVSSLDSIRLPVRAHAILATREHAMEDDCLVDGGRRRRREKEPEYFTD